VGPFTLVTGASSNHFACLRNLLFTISAFEPRAPLIVYDLGLSARESAQLRRRRCDLRRFPFENHPPHLDIRVARGQYAWKPVIIADTLRECGGSVLWLDAGNLLVAPLTRIRKVLRRHGLYCPLSGGDIRDWTHPGTLKYLKASRALLSKPNRNAACVGFNARHPEIPELAERWKACALDKRCIAPRGSDRSNHRQDQAVLSVLLYQFQRRTGCKLIDDLLDVFPQQDHRSASEVRQIIKSVIRTN